MEKEKWVNAWNDRLFKEIFYKEKNFDILKSLLECILKVEIKSISMLNNEKDRGNINIASMRTDLSLDTNEGYINVEVNSTPAEYVHPRNFAYLADTYSHAVLVGKKYDEKTKYIQINFSYGLMLDKNKKRQTNPKETEAIQEYKIRSKNGKEFVKNFLIYEINMDYFLDLCLSKFCQILKNVILHTRQKELSYLNF